MTNYQPLNDHLLVKVIEETKSGLILPKESTSPKAMQSGIVVELGEAVKGLSEGDIVFYRAQNGTPFGGFKLLQAHEILLKEKVV